MFFDHVEIDSLDFGRVSAMYSAVLPATLGCEVALSDDEAIFLTGEVSFLLIRNAGKRANVHVAFRLPAAAEVDAAHALAVRSGFSDNGAPGYRTAYAPNYYAAFVLDGDGNNVEFICRT